MDWESIAAQFPVNRHLVWLNNAGTTPAAIPVVNRVTDYLREYAARGILAPTERYEAVLQQIKAKLVPLLNCSPEEVTLVHNTAEGMNYISHGLDLRPGDEVILLENEYPSNVYPWQHWNAKGIRLTWVAPGKSPDEFLRRFKAIVGPRTRVASLSAVHWCTGMPLPLQAVGEICRRRQVKLVIDGAQAVGMQALDVQACNIAAMAFSAWKWLLGPLGLAVLYVSQSTLAELRPVFVGTGSVVNDRQYLPYKSELKPNADRYIISTANFIDWVYFDAALDFLVTIGFDRVRARIFELSALLNHGLRQLGFQVFSDHFAAHPTGISVAAKPGVPARQIVSHLRANGVVAVERLERVRFSPHIFLLPQHLEKALAILADL